MDEEKIYCSGTDPMTAALLTRDNGNNMNNPMWLIWAMVFGFGGNGFNRGGYGYNPEIESLRNQIADNKNSSDLMQFLSSHNSLLMDVANRTNTSVDFVRQSICQLSSAIERIAGDNKLSAEQVKNAVIMGDANITSKLQQCCCENKMLIQQMGYEGQLRDQGNHAATMQRIDLLANGITQGFSATAYEAAKHASEIMANQDKNTQRILDQMCADKAQELRDRLAEKDRELLLYKMREGGKRSCDCN